MTDRPSDIVSPVTNHNALLTMGAVDAAGLGRIPYDKPSPKNSLMAEQNCRRTGISHRPMPFTNELPEYGFVVQNFWNNANQHVVADPFEMVK